MPYQQYHDVSEDVTLEEVQWWELNLLPPFWRVVWHYCLRLNLQASLHQQPYSYGSVLVCSGSVQFSRSVVSDSLRPHEPQHARPPCPSPTPGVYPNSCPSNWWCHPTLSSSVVPFSSCPQPFPASGSFPMSQLFTSRSAQAAITKNRLGSSKNRNWWD